MKIFFRHYKSLRSGMTCMLVDDNARGPKGEQLVYVKTEDGQRFVLPYKVFFDERYFVPVEVVKETARGKAKPPKERCPTCDANMNVHKHTLNWQLLQALRCLQDAGGRANINRLPIDHNQAANWQKVQYLGLVEPAFGEDGQRDWGVWEITQLGHKFLAGEVPVQKYARTYRGQVIETLGPFIYVHEVFKERGYKKIDDYSSDAVGIHEVINEETPRSDS